MSATLAITATAFDRTAFITQARQLRALADGYEALGLDSGMAARWANQGFTPDEVLPWMIRNFTPERAGYHANSFRSPAYAADLDTFPRIGHTSPDGTYRYVARYPFGFELPA